MRLSGPEPTRDPSWEPAAGGARYFEDYRVGDVHDCGSVTVTEADIMGFAADFDPQYFHVDRMAAAQGPFGGIIASGWHTTAVQMRLFAEHYLPGVNSLGGAGVDGLRWPNPVRPGDELRLQVTVADARTSSSRPDTGIVTAHCDMTNQRGECVLSLDVVHLVRRRPQH